VTQCDVIASHIFGEHVEQCQLAVFYSGYNGRRNVGKSERAFALSRTGAVKKLSK